MEIPKESVSELSSRKQIEIIESIDYIHSAEMITEELLKLRCITAFAKRYFESEHSTYNQIISVVENRIITKGYVNGEVVSISSEVTFNKSRANASILALQDRNFDLLTRWLTLHIEDHKAYISK